jgi:hypothetical protein
LPQFDVLENPNQASRHYAPYVVVLQSHHLDLLDTVVLAPLVNDSQRVVSSVDIPLEFDGQRLVLVVGELAGVARRNAGRTIGSVEAHAFEIRRAFDRLLTGF